MTDLVVDAVTMAARRRRPGPGPIHHSDHGAQYTSLAFNRRLEALGIAGSMGSVGDALDNAVAESFYATLQRELLDRQAWATRQQLRTAIFEYVEGFYTTDGDVTRPWVTSRPTSTRSVGSKGEKFSNSQGSWACPIRRGISDGPFLPL